MRQITREQKYSKKIHLSHAVVVVEETDVLLLDDVDEGVEVPGEAGALVSKGVHGELDKHPGVIILVVGPACTSLQLMLAGTGERNLPSSLERYLVSI